jgi:hypothetical protein
MKKHPEGTDYKEVREHRDGEAHKYLHRAGYADGGEAKSDDGEPDDSPIPAEKERKAKKHGGEVADEKQDKKMIKAAVHKHEKHDHPGKPMTKLKEGGHVHGGKSKPRLDKFARGGHVKSKGEKGTKVNVIVAPGAGGGQGGPGGADPKMAFQAGVQTGAKAAAAKMGGAGGPPPAPGGAPGGMPPHPMPPAGGAPMPPPQMAQRGGMIKERGGSKGGLGHIEKVQMERKELKGKY